MFKNLSFYSLPDGFTAPEDLNDLLPELTPISSVELCNRGFVPVADGLGKTYHYIPSSMRLSNLHNPGHVTIVRLATQEKILPASVIREEVERRARAIEERDGCRPGKSIRNQLKDDVVADFTKRAFVRTSYVTGYIDHTARVLVVDTASDRAAERLITALREALTTFAVEPLGAEENVSVILSEWVKTCEPTDGFAIGDEIEMVDPVEIKTVVKAKRHDLTVEEIRDHLTAGSMMVSKLALIFEDRLSFTLDESLKVRRLRFTDLALESMGDCGGDAIGEFDARLTLLALEVRKLLTGLSAAFKIHGGA